MWENLRAIGTLTETVKHLAEATIELVEVSKAVHRERVIQLRQEYEEAKGDDNPKRINFTMFWLHERLQALEMKTGGVLPTFQDELHARNGA